MNPNSNQKRIAFGYNRKSNGQIVLHEGQAATVSLIYTYYLVSTQQEIQHHSLEAQREYFTELIGQNPR